MAYPARAVWAFVEQLDLSLVLDAIKARGGGRVIPRPARRCRWRYGFMRR